MKTTFSLFFMVFSFFLTMTAQPPQQIKYQGVVRNNSGNPLSNKNIALRIKILQQSEFGDSIYIEKHYTTTNQHGLFNINIGAGERMFGHFDSIQWNTYDFFQKVEIDTFGTVTNNPNLTHYVWMGTSQILSVPYSLASNISNYTLNNGYMNMWVFDTPGQYLFSINGGEGNYMIEAWGAGGGAFIDNDSISYAGGGGAYAKSVFHLKNGDGFLVQVGEGGKKSIFQSSGGDGNSSFFDNGTGIFVKAGGGKSGSKLGPGGYGTGQLIINGQPGQFGGFSQGNSGGNAPNGGFGGYYGSDGTAPGGGGSSMIVRYPQSIDIRLGNGANGRVVIYGQGNVLYRVWNGTN